MTTTNVPSLERSIQKTQSWLKDISTELGWNDPERGYLALRAVLHTLRDRLPPNEAVDLAAQLPMVIRGFYYEGWHPADKPRKYRHKDEFIEQVRRIAPSITQDEAEKVISAVFHQLSSELDGGEVDEVRNAMPEEVRSLWPRAGL
ncbi:MAG: DUF2267 domain-containing protein [Pseudomonadota bacterium]